MGLIYFEVEQIWQEKQPLALPHCDQGLYITPSFGYLYEWI